MSQVSMIDIEGNHPQIPTEFIGNVGFAIPLANVLELLAEAVPAGAVPAETVGFGNTITVQIQTTQAIAATDATAIGLSAFNSADFTVDANGFVSLISGSQSIGSISVDAATAPGTNPVLPTVGGLITVTGAQVAAETTTNVIRTNSISANSYTIQIQRSTAKATSTLGSNGVAHFNSSQFSVDANGFVTLAGSGAAQTITGNSGGAISPVAGNWNLVTANTTVTFAGTAGTQTLDFGLTNLLLGVSGSGITSGTLNVGVGLSALATATTAAGNVAIGNSALNLLSTGGNNVAVGYLAGSLATGTGSTLIGSGAGQNMTSGQNTYIGQNAGNATTTGTVNIAIGNTAYNTGLTGTRNIAIGSGSGSSYNAAESSNIVINNNGTAAESNVIRIGTQGSGTGQQSTCFIAGITGVAVANLQNVTINTATGQLGSAAPNLGDVVGPASSTDRAIATYNSTTGKLLRNNLGTTVSSVGTITSSFATNGELGFIVANGDNTNNSTTAVFRATVGGTSAGDAYSNWGISASTQWSAGLDNSASDSWVLSQNATLGTNNVIVATTAGEITKPLQPCFDAYNSAADADATGDGTAYTIICDTEVTDQGGDYDNSTGIFTAPVAGNYLFTGTVYLEQVGVAHTNAAFRLVITGGTTPYTVLVNPAAINIGGDIAFNISKIVKLTAGGTAKLTITVTGSTKTVDVSGAADGRTSFSGALIC